MRPTSMEPIAGSIAPGYDPVAAAFVENLSDHGDAGAAFCAYVDGRRVIDVWGGEARPGSPWQDDTMVVVFSSTKGPTALTVQVLAESGDLDVDAPIVRYWPEYGSGGKDAITLRHVLTHTAGTIDFPGYRRVIDNIEWWRDLDRIAADLATAEPAWEPGTAHGYHGVTFGLILGEVVRRATGTTLGTAFRSLVADPLDLDVWIGLPEEHRSRVAWLRDAPPVADPVTAAYLSIFTEDTPTARAHFCDERGISAMAAPFNDPEMWSAEFPSGGGIASARGLASMYAALAAGGALDGTRITTPAFIAAHTAEQVRGQDLVLLFETRYGLGFQRPTPFLSIAPADTAFGHGGLGGSLGIADPHSGIAAAYVMNQLQFPSSTGTTRARRLIDALYEAADG
jgi:CubicO group peptidase (beta-lactamase class C family)